MSNFNTLDTNMKWNIIKTFHAFKASIIYFPVWIHDYIHEGANGLLITTADFILDEPRGNSQSDSSIFGKTLFINLENNNYSIFSKGHRNSLGLEVIDKIIISSEHGPKGGY